MKRAALIFLLALALFLNACTVSVRLKQPESSFDFESSLALESEDPVSEYSEELSSEDDAYAKLCEEAYELILLDRLVIDIFANGALKSELAGNEPEMGEYGIITADSEFAYYSSIVSLLESVYTESSGVKERYLQSCPTYGPAALREGSGGRTEASFIYNAGFCPDAESASIKFLEETENGYAFIYKDGERSYTVNAERTENGLRLADSLYYIDIERQKQFNWAQNAFTERSGSCKTLAGECMIINVFANDSNSYWTDRARAEAKEMLSEGIDFLVSSAAEYGIEDLHFTTVDIDFVVGTDAVDYTIGGTYGDSAFIGTEYSGIKQFTDTLSKGKSFDNICVLFHFNKHGRSYFSQCDVDVTDENKWYYEYGVLFFSEAWQGEYFACPAVYAHELLHAFGAKDLYSGTVTDKGDYLADAYFSTDIMRYEPTNISYCHIGPLTAKLIGWEQWLDPQLKAMLDECY